MRNKHIADDRNYAIIFNRILGLYFKNSVKFQSISYTNISTDTLRTVQDPIESAKQTLGTAVLNN